MGARDGLSPLIWEPVMGCGPLWTQTLCTRPVHITFIYTDPLCCRPKLGSFCNTCVAIVYFSPRLLCRFDLAARALSISRRIASDREGLSFCCLAQFSIADLTVSGRRTVRTGSRP